MKKILLLLILVSAFSYSQTVQRVQWIDIDTASILATKGWVNGRIACVEGGTVDSVSKPGYASKFYADSVALANAGSGSSDSSVFATLFRLDTVKANRLTLWKYYLDSLNARVYSNNLYHPKIANGTNGYVWKMTSESTQGWAADISGGDGIDTTSLSNRIDSKISIADSNTKYITPITFKDSINNFQRAGTYLIPSDTIGTHNLADDLTWQTTKLTRSDTMTLSVRIDGKANTSHTQAQSTITNLADSLATRVMRKDTNIIFISPNTFKDSIDNFSRIGHTQAQSTVTNLSDSLLAKAQRIHGHLFSGITGAQDSLQQVRTLANSKQASGTYLVPSDTNNVRTYTNSQLALKLNKTDTMTLSVRIDKKTDTASVVMPWELGAYKTISSFATDTSNQRTYTNSQLALKLPYSDTTSSLARQWRLGAYKTISSFATDTSNQRTYTNNQLALKLNYADTSGRWTHVTKYGVDTTGQRTYTTNLLALKLPYSDTTSSLARQWRLGAYKTISSFATDTSNQRTYTNSQLALKFNQADTSTIIHWVDTNTIATKAYVNGKTDTVSTIAKKNTATPGSYTNSNITIALDGRITAISNGSAGSGGGSYSPWTYYGFTRISDTLVSVDHNIDFKAGKPIRFRDVDSVYRYALITQVKTGVSYDTLIISGPSFYSVADSLWLGPAEKVVKTDFGMTEYWSNYPTSGGLFDSLIYLHAGAEFKWGNSDAYLVQFAAVTRVIDVTAGTKLNVWKGSETLIGYKGLNMTSGNGTWMYSSAYYINPINYKVSYGNGIDLRIEIADTTPDARNLTVSMWFILE